jgi:hypothetical protein
MTHLLASEGGYQAFELGSAEWFWLIFSAGTAVLAIIVGFALRTGVLAADQGTEKMQEIARAIQEGALAYLKRQFRTIAIILVPLVVVVFFTATEVKNGDTVALTFVQSGVFPHACLPRRLLHVRGSPASSGWAWPCAQCAHRRCRPHRVAARGAEGRLPRRRCGRHVHRRPRSARCVDHHHAVQNTVGHPCRLRVRRVTARALPAWAAASSPGS